MSRRSRPARRWDIARAVLAAGGILAASWAMPAAAQYVVYFHTFGDWAVVCARDEPTGQTRCSLSAPSPANRPVASAPRLAVDVVAPAKGETLVGLHIDEPVDAARPVSLRVDSDSQHTAPVSRVGEASWRGAEAARLVDEMATGHTLVIQFFGSGTPAGTLRTLSVGSFAGALAAYREALARFAAEPSPLTQPGRTGF